MAMRRVQRSIMHVRLLIAISYATQSLCCTIAAISLKDMFCSVLATNSDGLIVPSLVISFANFVFFDMCKTARVKLLNFLQEDKCERATIEQALERARTQLAHEIAADITNHTQG